MKSEQLDLAMGEITWFIERLSLVSSGALSIHADDSLAPAEWVLRNKPWIHLAVGVGIADCLPGLALTDFNEGFIPSKYSQQSRSVFREC